MAYQYRKLYIPVLVSITAAIFCSSLTPVLGQSQFYQEIPMSLNQQKNDNSIIVLKIQWQRLVDKDQTCPRCGATEAEVDKAYESLQKSLNPLGIIVALEKKVIDHSAFEKNPSQSNLILVGGRPLEDWLQAGTGQSACCGPCGDTECRTIEKEGKIYETIPAELIIQAGLKAAQLFEVKKKISCCP